MRTVKNNNRSNQQKIQLCTCSTLFCTFRYRCFAPPQCELPETSQLHVLWRRCCMMLYVLLFTFVFLAAHFHLGGRQHFSFSHLHYEIFFTSNEVGLRCVFISRSSSFSAIHVNVNLKIQSKERLFFAVFFFSLKVRVAMRFAAETRGVLEMQNFTPTYMNGGRMSRQKITGFTKKKSKITNSKTLPFYVLFTKSRIFFNGNYEITFTSGKLKGKTYFTS